MIALIQRVNHASVSIDNQVCAAIGTGVVALVGIEKADTVRTADKLLERLLAYRIFPDVDGKMNLSLTDIDGGLLLVSQFTLAADTRKGLRPSFSSAKPPAEAEKLFDYLVERARANHSEVGCGRFAADMQVLLENDGPVTFHLQVPGDGA